MVYLFFTLNSLCQAVTLSNDLNIHRWDIELRESITINEIAVPNATVDIGIKNFIFFYIIVLSFIIAIARFPMRY